MSLSQENKNAETINYEMDENENFVKVDWLAEKCTSIGAGNTVSVSDLVPKLKGLQLQSVKSAGRVMSVIPGCGTAVVGPVASDTILDVGTAIFASADDDDDDVDEARRPRHVGHIADIFGSVHEPMYSVQLGEGAVALKVDAELFYLREHPSTGYISVKREAGDRYTIVRHTSGSP